MRTDFSDPLVVMALEQEGGDCFSRAQVPVLYTGVGKINAAYHLALRLAEYRLAGSPLPLVVNFGTAGSPLFETGRLVSCSAFVQRDMDASALGFIAGATPFDSAPAVLTFPSIASDLPDAVCGTGDSFATSHSAAHFNVVDMEAYALAKVCWLQGARFGSIKYITDGADGAAPDSWKINVGLAAERFLEIYRRLDAQRVSPEHR
jgi:adenosylhomocysteine nucleosidase